MSPRHDTKLLRRWLRSGKKKINTRMCEKGEQEGDEERKKIEVRNLVAVANCIVLPKEYLHPSTCEFYLLRCANDIGK